MTKHSVGDSTPSTKWADSTWIQLSVANGRARKSRNLHFNMDSEPLLSIYVRYSFLSSLSIRMSNILTYL